TQLAGEKAVDGSSVLRLADQHDVRLRGNQRLEEWALGFPGRVCRTVKARMELRLETPVSVRQVKHRFHVSGGRSANHRFVRGARAGEASAGPRRRRAW